MVDPKPYVPRRGDLVWISINPQEGHEQTGRRPAVVITPERYNHHVGLALCCPLTSQIKGYPFEVLIPEHSGAEGVVLADQVKSFDWRTRNAQFISALPDETIHAILQRVGVLLAE